MDFLSTPLPQSCGSQETVEQRYIPWNKDTKGLQVAHNKGKKMSAKTRAKISASHKGKTLSAEHRAKMSAARAGKTLSAETRAKMSDAQKGRIISAETRAKMSDAKAGRTKPSKYIYHTPAGVFINAVLAAEANKMTNYAIFLRCKHEKYKDWYRVKKVDNT